MKVLLINGSPHKNGCTFTALSEIAKTLQECGVDSEIFHIGAAPIRGCMGCGGCAGKGKCIYEDTVNTAIEKAAEADGFIFGSPVHYASAGGGITSFLDRMFYAGKSSMVYKPGAAVASCRPPRRIHCHTGSAEQIFHHFQHAPCRFLLLEYGAWKYPGGGASG